MRFSYSQQRKYIIDFKQVYIKHNTNINKRLYNKKTFPAAGGKSFKKMTFSHDYLLISIFDTILPFVFLSMTCNRYIPACRPAIVILSSL